MLIRGYVLRDGAGIVAVIPASHRESGGEEMAWQYIKKNRVLQTLFIEPNEDLVDFIIRVDKVAKAWRDKVQKGLN